MGSLFGRGAAPVRTGEQIPTQGGRALHSQTQSRQMMMRTPR